MRTHKQIISENGGAKKFAERLGVSAQNKVRFWEMRGSIPAEYWLDVSRKGLANLKELATDAARRKPEAA